VAAAPLLQQLRPDSLEAVQQAAAVHVAVQAGDEAAGKLLRLLQQQPMQLAEDWMAKVAAAFLGLGYSPKRDIRILHAVVQGLSVIASSAIQTPEQRGQGALDKAWHDHDLNEQQQQRTVLQAGSLLVELLQHPEQQVQQMLLQSLLAAWNTVALSAENPQQQQQQQQLNNHHQHKHHQPLAAGMVCLLLLPRVLECLVINGLSLPNASLQEQVAKLLLSLLLRGGAAARDALLAWRIWISCQAKATATADTDGSSGAAAAVGQLAAAIQTCWQQQLMDQQPLHALLEGSPGHPGWSTTECSRFWQGLVVGVLQDLFHVRAEVRQAAGRQLLVLLSGEDDAAAAQEEDAVAGERYSNVVVAVLQML